MGKCTDLLKLDTFLIQFSKTPLFYKFYADIHRILIGFYERFRTGKILDDHSHELEKSSSSTLIQYNFLTASLLFCRSSTKQVKILQHVNNFADADLNRHNVQASTNAKSRASIYSRFHGSEISGFRSSSSFSTKIQIDQGSCHILTAPKPVGLFELDNESYFKVLNDFLHRRKTKSFLFNFCFAFLNIEKQKNISICFSSTKNVSNRNSKIDFANLSLNCK